MCKNKYAAPICRFINGAKNVPASMALLSRGDWKLVENERKSPEEKTCRRFVCFCSILTSLNSHKPAVKMTGRILVSSQAKNRHISRFAVAFV